MNQILLLVASILGAIGLYAALMMMLGRSRVQLRAQRMVSETGAFGAPEEHAPSAAAEFMERLLYTFGTDVEKVRKETYVELGRAGIVSPNAATYFLFIQRLVLPLVAVASFFFLFHWATGEKLFNAAGLLNLLLGLILFTIGLRGGALYLSNRQQKRKHILTRSFPDAVDLLLLCVESGLSLDAALTRVCRELGKAHPLITEELERTRMELNILSDRTQALQNLAERADITGFRSLVSSLIQSEKFGTSLADTLRVLSDDFRMTRLLNAENKAARVPALITIPLIAFIFLPLLITILAPPLIKLSQHGGGSITTRQQ